MSHPMLQALLGCLLVVAQFISTTAAQSPSATQSADSLSKTDKPSIAILSYNVRYLNKGDGLDVWDNRRDKVVETIRRGELIGLQEVVAKQLEFVKLNTPSLEWYGVGRDDGTETGGEMTAIGWSKERFEVSDKGTFWLSETPETVGSRGWDAALPRVASWISLIDKQTQKPLLFVNTHFDHRGAEARKQSATLIRDWIATHRKSRPAVLVGDLNSLHDSEPLRALAAPPEDASSTLLDAFSHSAHPPTGATGTFNSFKEISEGRRIDHVFFTGAVEVDSFQTLDPKTASGRFASDHQPLLVHVQLP